MTGQLATGWGDGDLLSYLITNLRMTVDKRGEQASGN